MANHINPPPIIKPSNTLLDFIFSACSVMCELTISSAFSGFAFAGKYFMSLRYDGKIASLSSSTGRMNLSCTLACSISF